jgi:osmotically-inducible protein OsmY
MKENEELRKDVQDAIEWQPQLESSEIGVIADNGIITLTGSVDSYSKKIEAEEAAKKVSGVKAVVEKINIVFGNDDKKNDNEIAAEVLRSLKWNWKIPHKRIKIKVEDGWVTLEGDVKWHFEKEAAKKAIDNLLGVKGIINEITIKSETDDMIERVDIITALSRNSSLQSRKIDVKVKGNNVTLNGSVNSWYQKQEAGRVAFDAPGVWTVDNQLSVDHDYSLNH